MPWSTAHGHPIADSRQQIPLAPLALGKSNRMLRSKYLCRGHNERESPVKANDAAQADLLRLIAFLSILIKGIKLGIRA